MKNIPKDSRKVVSLSIPPALHDAATEKARELGYTFSGYVAELIRKDRERLKGTIRNDENLNKN